MSFQASRGLIALFALLLGACGSRSGLLSATTGSSGGGGAPAGGGSGGGTGASAGTGATGGSGGSGGAGGSAFCPGFDLTGEPIGFELDPYQHRHAPYLANANVDSSRVGFVSAEIPAESPGPVAAHLRMAAFSPWSAWPASIGGEQSAFVAGVDQVALDRGAEYESLAVAYPASPAPPASEPEGLFFANAVSLSSGNFPGVESLALSGPKSHVARFVRAGNGAHLVGFESHTSADYAFHVAYSSGAGGTGVTSWVGCATTPMSADAVEVPGGGFVFAFATSRLWGTCLNDSDIDTPAHRILGGFVGGPGGGYGPVPISIDADDIVGFVRLLPRQSGAWLAWQYQGINAEVPPPVMLMRLSDSGAPVSEPIPILDGGAATGQPALAALGDGLVLAWLDTKDPFGATLMLRVLNGDGQPVTERAFQPSGAYVEPRLSLLASPGADQLLLGWSSAADVASLDAWVARFCVPGP